jgi:hypothetical protein
MTVDVRKFGHAINTDDVFGTHNWADFITSTSDLSFQYTHAIKKRSG